MMLSLQITDRGVVARVSSRRNVKVIEVNLRCILNIAHDSGLDSRLEVLEVMSAVLSSLLAVARYAEKFGDLEGICLDYVFRELCTYDPDVASLISTTIGMMIYSLLKQSDTVPEKEILNFISGIRQCIEVTNYDAGGIATRGESDRSSIEFC